MSKEYGEDFATDVKINRFKLPQECEEHSSLYQYYADLLADARVDVDVEKDRLNIVEAERELDIRKNPPESPKITEAVIKALVQSDGKVVKRKGKLGGAKDGLYHLEAAVTALEHRKRMLDSLVQLLIAGYYSAPKTERKPDMKETDKASANVRGKLNKNKKTGGKRQNVKE